MNLHPLLKSYHVLIVVFSVIYNTSHAQNVILESSNLPIIIIDTKNDTIPDEPKITARMGIIHNEDGSRNMITDSFNVYNGWIGIEKRGFSSQTWPKKPYGIETRDSSGNNLNVSIFGMPSENDWVLYAPFVDKTLFRNVLVYHLAREMGWYAPRTEYCELVINGEYRGVYVFTEKLKRDKNRIDLAGNESADSAGSFLLEMTSAERIKPEEVFFTADSTGASLVIKYPDQDAITDKQIDYIKQYYNHFDGSLFEDGFNDPVNGYRKYIDVSSFIDHMILAEAFHQLDAFCLSQYFFKSEDGKLSMGPAWDFNRSMGNASYFEIWKPEQWWLRTTRGNTRIPYANRFMLDSTFLKEYAARWYELRQSIFSFEYIYAKIDGWIELLEEARERNFSRWPVLGVSYYHKYVFDTYEEEVDYLKKWIHDKFTWLDKQCEGLYDNNGVKTRSNREGLNPVKQSGRSVAVSIGNEMISFTSQEDNVGRLVVYSLAGRQVRSMVNGFSGNCKEIKWDYKNVNGIKVNNGTYLFKIVMKNSTVTGKLTINR